MPLVDQRQPELADVHGRVRIAVEPHVALTALQQTVAESLPFARSPLIHLRIPHGEELAHRGGTVHAERAHLRRVRLPYVIHGETRAAEEVAEALALVALRTLQASAPVVIVSEDDDCFGRVGDPPIPLELVDDVVVGPVLEGR